MGEIENAGSPRLFQRHCHFALGRFQRAANDRNSNWINFWTRHNFLQNLGRVLHTIAAAGLAEGEVLLESRVMD